jgi:hypothetical protein
VTRWLLSVVATVGVVGVAAGQEPPPPRDVDAWHEAFREAVGADILEPESNGWSLGLYPNLGLALGPPDWIAYQVGGYVSIARQGSFSVFTGYSFERGPGQESHMASLGWGGVRRLSGSRSQRGFYGKFLRYRRLTDFDHGVHHGVSVGTETNAGVLGFSMEVGAARSPQNHWAVIAQVGLKVGLPIFIPLSRDAETQPGS